MANKKLFDSEHVRERRTFPKGSAVGLTVLVTLQILLLLPIFLFHPQPQDRILDYEITVDPRADGSLDITYSFRWEPLDSSEPLTWVEIGMANKNFTINPDSISENIRYATKDTGIDEDGDGYAYVRLDFTKEYTAGEIFTFSFCVNQEKMLCENTAGYFYELIPGWFNATPVEQYTFRWRAENATADTEKKFGYYVWSGSLDCGDTVTMRLDYPKSAFDGAPAVPYESPDIHSENELLIERIAICVVCGILIFGIGIVELWLIDSFVSYTRGRGFICCYGYHIHLYGRPNPSYQKERDRRMQQASHGGHGSGGGGCACACACACAGGGRAGCSQKDTTPVHPSANPENAGSARNEKA